MAGALVQVLDVNPARAGMILKLRRRPRMRLRKPRASGDDPSFLCGVNLFNA